jgi:hypothetical protein
MTGNAPTQQPAVRLNELPSLGELRGVATYNGDDKITYVAAWYWVGSTTKIAGDSLLVVFESGGNGFHERFRTKSGLVNLWEQLRALPSGAFPGFIIETSQTITDHDGDLLVAMVNGKFKVVYQGAVSEFVDFNADGYPEILESD